MARPPIPSPWAPDLQRAVDDFLAYAARSQARETTKSSYRRALGRFFAAEGITTLAQAETLTSGRRAIQQIEHHTKPATAAQVISAAKQFYLHLKTLGRPIADPMLGIRAGVINNVPEWNVLREGQTAKLLETIDDARDYAVVITLVMQGWRASELAAMTWGHLHRDRDGWSAEWRGKRSKLRAQGMQDEVMGAIEAIGGERRGDSPLIPKKGSEPLTRYSVWAIVRKYADAAGFNVTPHGLRATYISGVVKRKGITAAQDLAGHTNIQTTQRYNRWVIKRDDKLSVRDL